MQSTSALYKNIVAGRHWFETKIVIDGVTYTETDIISVSTSTAAFSTDAPNVGGCVSSEINLTMINPSVPIPRMASVIPYVRARNATQSSEWIQKGAFFIDTRSVAKTDANEQLLTIHGYDAMLKSEQYYTDSSLTWPARDTAIVSEIAGKIGVSVDPRNAAIMTRAYTMQFPVNYTLRETLGYIAAMYAGCFIISDVGQLRLVTLWELPAETNYLINEAGFAITFGGDRIIV